MSGMRNINTPRPGFNRVGCTFLGDEGYVSYGDSFGTEITALEWPEAVEVFRLWWEQKREWQAKEADVRARRAALRIVGRRS